MTNIFNRALSFQQFTMPMGWPVCLRLGSPNGFAFLCLPAGHAIAWNVDPEPEERVAWQRGHLVVTRPETELEESERLYDEAEAAWEDYCSDFYSY